MLFCFLILRNAAPAPPLLSSSPAAAAAAPCARKACRPRLRLNKTPKHEPEIAAKWLHTSLSSAPFFTTQAKRRSAAHVARGTPSLCLNRSSGKSRHNHYCTAGAVVFEGGKGMPRVLRSPPRPFASRFFPGCVRAGRARLLQDRPSFLRGEVERCAPRDSFLLPLFGLVRAWG
jgi:hypothetical protein